MRLKPQNTISSMIARSFLFITFLLAFVSAEVYAQDTLRISYDDFVSRIMESSGQVKYARENIELAENQVDQAKAQRFLPNIRFESQHGLVPGVESDSTLPSGRPLPRDQYYLDPNLTNDWTNWAIYTKFNISVAQPIFLWGGINKTIEAARKGAEAVRLETKAKEADLESRLFDLYFSYVLAFEVERLLREADDMIGQVDSQIENMKNDEDSDLDESEVFKFDIFKSEFDIQKEEVFRNMEFVRETWNFLLNDGTGNVYEPEIRFLDPIPTNIEPIGFYQNSAFNNRPEIKALKAGKDATETYIDALKRRNLPGLYLGGYINFAYTPNRPYQDNPFIINSTNYFNGGAAFIIRQNLNFFSIKANMERSKIELRRLDYAQEAAQEGIMLEVNENYRQATLADVKVEKTDEALVKAKNWVRSEQLDYDLGFGEVKDLTDAMKKELELKLQLVQSIYDLNTSLAKLNKSAGMPLHSLLTK